MFLKKSLNWRKKMFNNHKSYSRLEEIAAAALDEVSTAGGNGIPDFRIQARFSTNLLSEEGLLDVEDKARDWQAVIPSNRLFFSHGQFIGADGISNVAEELKKKSDSNRALVSLICQKDIVGSQDKPIPSFMLLQCALEGSALRAAVYYRALEISAFFRINLEEIRLMLKSILDLGVRFEEVALTVLAFRAYIAKGMVPLERADFDMLNTLSLMSMLSETPRQLPNLLRDKSRHTTVVETEMLKEFARILDHPCAVKWAPSVKVTPALKSRVKSAIEASEALQKTRMRSSHDSAVAQATLKMKEALERLASEAEKCVEH